MVYFDFLVLPCRVFVGVDRVGVVDKGLGGGVVLLKILWVVLTWGVVDEFEVEPQVVPMAGLHFLGKVSLLQDVWMIGD